MQTPGPPSVLRDEWDKLAKQHPDRFKAVYTLDNPPFMLWKGEPGPCYA